jgi:hypothetical protein
MRVTCAGFAMSSEIVGEGIVGEDKFAFNNTREATLHHEVWGCWPPFAG